MDWNALAYEICSELIRIIMPVAIVLCLKWAVDIYKKLAEKHPELAKLLSYAGQIGYDAAEEYFRDYDDKVPDDHKMAVAVEHARDYLAALGISVNDDVIEDAVNAYGVSNYKFSWCKPALDELLMYHPGGEEEGDESDTAGYMREWAVYHSDDADHNEHGEGPVREDQTVAARED